MSMRNLTVHDANGERPLSVDIKRCFNLGFTMRDPEKMQRHLEECYAMGVKEVFCDRPPLVMPISPWAVVTDDEIQVQRPRTSGEVEIVTLADADGTVYVGVGSDHTDRTLESYDIPWAKQVAPNIVAPDVWLWSEVEEHWDDVVIECDVIDDGTHVAYQKAGVSEFWTPAEMLEGARDSITPTDGAIILFSGTVVSLDETLRFAESWTIRMIDPVLDRTIEHTYSVVVLAPEVLNDGSTDGDVASASNLVGS